MKKVYISGKEIKRRGWKVAKVYGTSVHYVIPPKTKAVVGNYINFEDQSRMTTGHLKGRNGAYLLCPQYHAHSIKVVRHSVLTKNESTYNVWTYLVDGNTTLKQFGSAKAAAQSNKDTCGCRFGHFFSTTK